MMEINPKSALAWLFEIKPEDNPKYPLNDIGSSRLFAEWCKEFARFVPERKKWFVYTGKRWESDTVNLQVMEYCKLMAQCLWIYAADAPGCAGDDLRKQVSKWQRRSYRESILRDAASVYPVPAADFDKDPMLFNCINGTLNLQTREFRPHRPEDLLSKISGVRYDPKAESNLWSRFVMEVMQDDIAKASFLQKALGYGLTGDTAWECFFVLFGPTTRNGKGTTMETYMKLMGDYGRAANPETLAQKKTQGGAAPSEDIARLVGARAVNVSEPSKELVLSAALVKTLTGSDSVTARYLHENSFEYRPQFKLFINTNHLPKITDMTVFSSGRVKVIPFERHFTDAEQDRQLKRKLTKAKELSGILNWCLQGLDAARRHGFQEPPSVRVAVEEYRKENDKIARFVDECMELDPAYEVRSSEAFQRFQTWCISNGYQPGGSAKFNAEMAKYSVVTRKRPKGGGGTTTVITGMRLLPIGVVVQPVEQMEQVNI